MSTTIAPAKAPEKPHFQQRLGLFDSTMLVAGTMIGSGIFITSHDIAADVGSAGWLLAVWILAGVMTVIGALSYAELSAMMPQAGGQYVYLREAYSPLWGFLYGWTCFLVIQTGSIAAVGVAFAKFLGVLLPMLGADPGLPDPELPNQVPLVTSFFPDLGWAKDKQHATVIFAKTHVNLELSLPFVEEPFFKLKHFVVTAGQLVAVVVIGFLTLLNCRGVQEGKIVQNVMTVAKTLALVALIAVGIFMVGGEPARSINQADWFGKIEHTDAFGKVVAKVGGGWLLVALMVMGGAMVGALFSADAWNNITFTAGEIRNPRRNLPLSLALGTGSVVLLYFMANWAYVESLPVQGDKTLRAPFEKRAAEATKRAEELTKKGEVLEAQAARDQAAEASRQGDKFRRDELNEKEAENARQEAQLLIEHGKAQEAEKYLAQEDLHRQQAAFYRGIDDARDERVGTAVMELVSPRFGAKFMAIAIMISTFGCVNGMILMGARLYYVMAQDNLFFRSVGTLNHRGVPATGLILQALWSILLVFTGKYGDLLDYVIFAVLVFYVLTVAGLFILRRTRPNAERPYRALGYPVLPALYVVLCAVIMVDLLIVKPQYTWPGLIIVLTGIPVYFLWRLTGRRTTTT